MIFFYVLWSLLIVQRIYELYLSNKHKREMKILGAIQYDLKGYKFIVVMHISFFVCMVIENLYHGHINQFSYSLFVVFVLAQLLRYWAIVSLGKFWNTKIIVLREVIIIKKGPYKYFKHPNYAAVIIEFFSIPLIFSLYYCAIIFSTLNLFVLFRRIKIEEKALGLD